MTTHSKLAPSSAARRMACPGSRAMTERYGRNEESEASKEGTRAHELAAVWLTLYGFDRIEDAEGYTEEMIEGAKLYKHIVQTYLPFDTLNIEKRVDMPNIHPEMWGTPDAWGVSQTVLFGGALLSKILHVFDYKFGHTPVEAYENWQLLAYACGIVYGVMEKDHEAVTDIYLHIVQPRDFASESKHKVWHLTAEELESYRQRLITSEALAMSSHPQLKVSAECKYCPARHACPALKQAAFGAAEVSFRDAPQGLTPQEIGGELKMLQEARDLLDFRISALEAEVEHLLMTGHSVEFYEIKPTTGRLAWAVDPREVLAMGEILGVDLRKDDVITPTQAIKKGIPEETMLKYADRKTSLKLSRVDVKKVKAVFNQC